MLTLIPLLKHVEWCRAGAPGYVCVAAKLLRILEKVVSGRHDKGHTSTA